MIDIQQIKIDAAKTAIRAVTRPVLAKALADEYRVPERQMRDRVDKWFYNGVPPRYVPSVERETGVSRTLLAPEIYRDK